MYYLYRGTYPEVYTHLNFPNFFNSATSHQNLGKKAYLAQINLDLTRTCCLSDQYDHEEIYTQLRDTRHLDETGFYGYVQADFDGRIFSEQYKNNINTI